MQVCTWIVFWPKRREIDPKSHANKNPINWTFFLDLLICKDFNEPFILECYYLYLTNSNQYYSFWNGRFLITISNKDILIRNAKIFKTNRFTWLLNDKSFSESSSFDKEMGISSFSCSAEGDIFQSLRGISVVLSNTRGAE